GSNSGRPWSSVWLLPALRTDQAVRQTTKGRGQRAEGKGQGRGGQGQEIGLRSVGRTAALTASSSALHPMPSAPCRLCFRASGGSQLLGDQLDRVHRPDPG